MRTARDLSVCRTYQKQNVFQQQIILYFTKAANNKNDQIMACKFFYNQQSKPKSKAVSSVLSSEISGQFQKKGMNNFC